MIALSTKVLKHIFTGPDGETYAAGRVWTAPFGVVGLGVPVGMLAAGQTISLEAMAIYMPALAGALALLISGTNMTEPRADAA